MDIASKSRLLDHVGNLEQHDAINIFIPPIES